MRPSGAVCAAFIRITPSWFKAREDSPSNKLIITLHPRSPIQAIHITIPARLRRARPLLHPELESREPRIRARTILHTRRLIILPLIWQRARIDITYSLLDIWDSRGTGRMRRFCLHGNCGSRSCGGGADETGGVPTEELLCCRDGRADL